MLPVLATATFLQKTSCRGDYSHFSNTNDAITCTASMWLSTLWLCSIVDKVRFDSNDVHDFAPRAGEGPRTSSESSSARSQRAAPGAKSGADGLELTVLERLCHLKFGAKGHFV